MADILRIQDLKAEEIATLLESRGRHLASDQEAAVRNSSRDVRRVKEAWDTSVKLGNLLDAA
jgi:hypothetical protein